MPKINNDASSHITQKLGTLHNLLNIGFNLPGDERKAIMKEFADRGSNERNVALNSDLKASLIPFSFNDKKNNNNVNFLKYLASVSKLTDQCFFSKATQCHDDIEKVEKIEEHVTPFDIVNAMNGMIVGFGWDSKGKEGLMSKLVFGGSNSHPVDKMISAFVEINNNTYPDNRKEVVKEISPLTHIEAVIGKMNKDVKNCLSESVEIKEEEADYFWLQCIYPELREEFEGGKKTLSKYNVLFSDKANCIKKVYVSLLKNKNDCENRKISFDGRSVFSLARDPIFLKHKFFVELIENLNNLCSNFEKVDYKKDLDDTAYPQSEYLGVGNFKVMGENKEVAFGARHYKIEKDSNLLEILSHLILIKNTVNSGMKNAQNAFEELTNAVLNKCGIKDGYEEYSNEYAFLGGTGYNILQDIIKTIVAEFHVFLGVNSEKEIALENNQFIRVCDDNGFIRILELFDLNGNLDVGFVKLCLNRATVLKEGERGEFYFKIKEFIEEYNNIKTDNYIDSLKEKYLMTYQNKTYDEIRKELKNCLLDRINNFLNEQKEEEIIKNYMRKEPLLRETTENSLILYQNGMTDKSSYQYHGKSYEEYIESIIRILDKINVFDKILKRIKKEEGKINEDNFNNFCDLIESIEKKLFELLLLEYNEEHNFENWWNLYKKNHIEEGKNIQEMIERTKHKYSALDKLANINGINEKKEEEFGPDHEVSNYLMNIRNTVQPKFQESFDLTEMFSSNKFNYFYWHLIPDVGFISCKNDFSFNN